TTTARPRSSWSRTRCSGKTSSRRWSRRSATSKIAGFRPAGSGISTPTTSPTCARTASCPSGSRPTGRPSTPSGPTRRSKAAAPASRRRRAELTTTAGDRSLLELGQLLGRVDARDLVGVDRHDRDLPGPGSRGDQIGQIDLAGRVARAQRRQLVAKVLGQHAVDSGVALGDRPLGRARVLVLADRRDPTGLVADDPAVAARIFGAKAGQADAGRAGLARAGERLEGRGRQQ